MQRTMLYAKFDVKTGKRLTPYVIEGEAGIGLNCINGAAHLVQPGDIAIVNACAQLDDAEARTLVPRVRVVDNDNRIVEVSNDAAVVPDAVGLEAFATPRQQL